MQTTSTNQTKTRFDMYVHVHKGLRAFMTDVLTTVGRIDPFDPSEVGEGAAQVRLLLAISRDHLFHENHFLHSAMDARSRGSACKTANEHVAQESLFEELENQLASVERSSIDERPSELLRLYRSLSLFVAENFQHMIVEEQENNHTLWAFYTDTELVAIHQELLRDVTPDKMTVYLRWILPYIPHPDRLVLLSGMRESIPPAAFDALLSTIRPHFSHKDWRKLNGD